MRRLDVAKACVVATLILSGDADEARAQDRENQTGPTRLSCDRTIIPAEDAATRYQPRANRCEGFYYVPRTGTPVIPASFLGGSIPKFQSTPPSIVLHWRLPPSDTAHPASLVHVRALLTTGGRFYRMDYDAGPQDSVFVWPLDQARRAGVQLSDLEISVWLQPQGRREDAVLLPVVTGSPSLNGTSLLRLMIEQPVSELRYSLIHPRSNKVDSVVVSDSLLGTGHFGSNTRALLRIPKSNPGIYRIEFSCSLGNDAPWTHFFRLFLAP